MKKPYSARLLPGLMSQLEKITSYPTLDLTYTVMFFLPTALYKLPPCISEPRSNITKNLIPSNLRHAQPG